MNTPPPSLLPVHFSYPINPSYTDWRKTSTAACPATARVLMRVQVLQWRLLLPISQNRNLDLTLPSFLRCPSYYLPIPGRRFGHILFRNSVQDPQTPPSSQKLFSFSSSFSPVHLSFGHYISGRGTQTLSNIVMESGQ